MKGKRANYIWIGAISAVLIAAVLAIVLFVFKKDNTEVAYTYEAASENLPEYDTDLFNIDGKLDEDIYKKLRWWEEEYSEGDMQDAVKVRATSYLGENGVYFIFDVDDDNVNVDMKRASYNNSSITVYAAEEGTHTLEDNVWEIDLLPTDYINAKRYLGGYYYGTVRANGYENQPFVRSTTKGGAVNTPECKGYIMESYFPYGFLFKEGEKPENINLNFALQRSYSLEADARDVYYNFGQNVMSNWSWGDPGTWWTFHKMGLDSVDLTLDSGKGGKLEYRNDYIARYQTEKVTITPDKGYRISGLLLETKDETTNVIDQITWKDEVNTIKLRNVTDDVTLKASFEKIPTTKVTLAGRITGKGEAKDLGVRFICGGIAYVGTVAEDGSYSLEVPTGDGVIDVYSKSYGYVAKKVNVVAGSGTVTTNIKLTADDYGNKRVMSLPSEQVMGNKERVFDGTKMTGSMSKTFAYDFTLKHNGKLLEEDGTPVADPTFGEFDNQYTSINFKGVFTDADGKPIENSDMQLQIMSWNGKGMWMVKMWLDGQYVEARLGIDELKAFGSEEGVSFRLIFANSKLSLCVVRGNNVYKLTEVKAKATDERYLKTLDFYAEHCVNHSIWYVENQTLSLGRTEANSHMVANVANGDGVVSFKKSENGKLVRTSTNWDAHTFDGAFGWTGTLRVPGVLKNGKIQYHEMKTGYWVDTCKDDKDWYQFTVYIIGDGDSYYVTKNNQKTKLELNAEQIKLLGTTGLQVGAFANGNAVSYFVDNGKGEMEVFADLYDFNENQAWYPWPNKYSGAYLIHEGAPSLGKVISTGAEFYTGLSKDMDVKGFVKNVLGDKYQSTQVLNPVTHTFDSEKNNYFEMNHKDVKENAFYGYNIKLDALKNTSVSVTTKAWSKKYYANRVRLRVTEDSAYFIWEQGVSPYSWSEAVYFLNDTQIAKLTNGGLDIFLAYKDNSPELNLYVDDGTGKLVLASTYKEELFEKSTGVTEVKNLIGYNVKVENSETNVTVAATGCVVPEDGDFANSVKALYNKEIVSGDAASNLIKIDSQEISKATEKINLDYDKFNIGGNWFDRFNVKLSDAVDKDGKILADAKVEMLARLQGDKYYGQKIYLHLEKDGIGYLEFTNHGGNRESYYYRLTDNQLAQLASEEGLNLFVGHKDNENKVTLYIADGTELIPMKSFVYGKTELWAKGYSASYEGGKKDSVEVTVDCYKYEGSMLDALKQAYDKAYAVSDETVLIYTDFVELSKEFDGKEKDSVKTEHRKAGIPSIWQAVLKSDAVNAEGNVLKASETLIVEHCNDWNYQFNTTLKLTDTESVLMLQEGDHVLGNYKLHKYYLNQEQLAQLATEDGLKLYVSYENKRVTVYVEENADTLVKVLTFSQPNLVMNSAQISYSQSDVSMDVSLSGYMYENGVFEEAVNTIYDHDYIIREKTAIEATTVSKHTIDAVTEKVNEDYGDLTVSGTWLNHYTVKLPEAVHKDGSILATAQVKMTAKIQGNIYYGQGVNLYLEKDGIGYLEIINASGDWESYYYQLSEKQLVQLASSEGLNLFVGHEEGEKQVTVYLADGTEIIPLKAFAYGNKELRGKSYAASYEGEETNNIEITMGCYKYDGTIEETIQLVYNENAAISDKKVIIQSETYTIDSATETVKAKLYNKGNWMQYINVKSDAALNSTIKLMTKMDLGNNIYFQQSVNVRFTESGAYLEMPNYGGGDWNTYVYPLSESQVKQVKGQQGLDIYVSSANTNKIAVYVAEGNKLIKVKEFTYGSMALNATEYVASYVGNEDDKIQIVSKYLQIDGTVVEACKTLYDKNYSEENATGVYWYKNIDDTNISNTLTANGEKISESKVKWNEYFAYVNMRSEGVNANGVVQQNSEMKITHSALGNSGWLAGTHIFLKLQKDATSTIMLERELSQGVTSTTTYSGPIELSEAQLKALASADGLNLYITHSDSAMDTFVVYMEDGNVLREMFKVQYSGVNHGQHIIVEAVSLTSNFTVKCGSYNYKNVDLNTAINTVNGKAYTIAKQVKVNVAKSNASVSGIKTLYNVGDTVSFTVQVDEGYKLETVTLNDTPLTADKDGKYQFELTEEHLTACDVKVTTKNLKALISFINHSGYNTNTGSKLDSVKSRMGTEPYLFHSKFKTTVDSMIQFNSTNDYYVRIGYEGWGSNGAEQYYVGLYKEANGVWKIKFYRGTDWWPQHLIAEYELSEEQIGQLTGDGLDIFLVNSGGTVFTLYVEQDGVVDRVGTIDSPRKNQQVYNVLHASKDTNASLVTNGYFYGTGYTRATIAQKIYEN